ncbi:hypothetical protein BDA99DRAFT_86111 [Phascolomyces articulosus]|uniref:Uncharacterized protein n=1 Tax=Phascolomyces articulosus TaxID=60185 RepID=A0AAD5K8U4_9FUNG|nr:hypothetical protein BDA99DRAFT_86111 [Phascolomyces articulosus]
MHQPTIGSMNFSGQSTINPSLRSLYPLIYKLHKGNTVDIDQATKYFGKTLHDKLYQHCVNLMKKYKYLTKLEVSYLHATLSGIVNMLNKQDNTLMNFIPDNTVSEVSSVAKGIVDIQQLRVIDVLDHLYTVYHNRGIQGLRVESILKKASIISQGGINAETSIEYKVYDIMEVIINELEYGNWCTSSKSETDCLFYWKNILHIISERRMIHKKGELTSTATKFERVINEYEFGETNKNVSGRKIDLLIQTTSVNIQNKPEVFDLSSMEFKKSGSDDIYLISQQNKNIRTMKSVLASLLATTNHIDVVLGMDIVGVSGYMFAVLPYEGVTFATNVTDDKIVFLPVNKYDLDDFLDKKKYVLPLLFTYKVK